jgi:hypothetical protein
MTGSRLPSNCVNKLPWRRPRRLPRPCASTQRQRRKKGICSRPFRSRPYPDEEAVQRGVAIIQRAVKNGQTEVEVYRFPSELCTDHGRAINQTEPGWESTLSGVPKQVYELWHMYFRLRGYKLRVQIVDWPGGMPGDIAMTLSW